MCDNLMLKYLNVLENNQSPQLNITAELMGLAITDGMWWQAGVREENREDAIIVATIKLVFNELFVEHKGVLSRGLK